MTQYPQPYYRPQQGVNGLGVAGFICGLTGLLFSFIPLCGAIPAIVLALVGFILSFVGFLTALSDKRTGIGFPILGMLTCVAPFVLSLLLLIGGITLFGKAVNDAAQESQRRAATQQTTPSPLRAPTTH